MNPAGDDATPAAGRSSASEPNPYAVPAEPPAPPPQPAVAPELPRPFTFTADWSPAGVRQIRSDVSTFWPTFWLVFMVGGSAMAWLLAALNVTTVGTVFCCFSVYFFWLPAVAWGIRVSLRRGRVFVRAVGPLAGPVHGVVDTRWLYARSDSAVIRWPRKPPWDITRHPRHDEVRTRHQPESFPVPHEGRTFIADAERGDTIADHHRRRLLRGICRWFDGGEFGSSATTVDEDRWTFGGGWIGPEQRRHVRWYVIDAGLVVIALAALTWAADHWATYRWLFEVDADAARGQRELATGLIVVKSLAGFFFVGWVFARNYWRRQPLGPYDVAVSDDAVVILDPRGSIFGYRGGTLRRLTVDETGWWFHGPRRRFIGTDRFVIPRDWFVDGFPDRPTALDTADSPPPRYRRPNPAATGPSSDTYLGPNLPKWE